MKNLSVLVVLALVAGFLCSGCTMTESTSEHLTRICTAQKLQFKMMMEDLDYVLLLEQPSYATPWSVRGGLSD